MSQAEKATRLAGLHQKGNPLVLYNIWDAGGAKALEESGAQAVATGSWSMAAAHGYADGESLPLDFVLDIVTRICTSVEVPVTVDFEGAYATDPHDVAENVRKIMRTGAVGINFEDRIVKGKGLHPLPAQVARIQALKATASEEGIPLFLNARTDLFLGTDPSTHKAQLAEAMERAAAYAKAGADGFFVPGLVDATLLSQLIESADLPINVMMTGAFESIRQVASLGVSRASFGPAPFFRSLSDLKAAYAAVR